ncbi:hypothetical protein [Paraburkholderia sp.]|uniref:hypothetical protein n=1 Tax=Paraburkholderia sp. TaxID=1926495 RepID=UPI0025F89BD7|nr:hypothetical protein [Paraburkholderia sp.]
MDLALSTLQARGVTATNKMAAIDAPPIRAVGQIVKAFLTRGSKPSVKRLASKPDKLLKIENSRQRKHRTASHHDSNCGACNDRG